MSVTEPLDVGARRQLFIDSRFIESQKNVALAVSPPVKAGPIELGAETSGMIGVVEHEGLLLMYFRVVDGHGLAAAQSEDGVSWQVCSPGSFGDERTIPLPGVGAGAVFIDPKDAEHPFKGLFSIRQAEPWGVDPAAAGDVGPSQLTQATERGGLHLFRSRDGLRWELVPGLPVPFLCDTQNQVLYDHRIGRYVAYLRAFPTLGGPHRNKRCVARTDTDRLADMPWPHRPNPDNQPQGDHDYPYIQDEMPIVMAADEEDPPGTDLYGPGMHLYPWGQDVYLAFPAMYRSWGYSGKTVSYGRDHRGERSNDGLFETHLCVSRDGVDFTRYRTPYLPSGMVRDRLGVEGELDCGLISMGLGMVRRGDHLFQYYYGSRKTHMSEADGVRFGFRGAAVFRAVQRLDGFVSATVDWRGGEIVTPPITFAGERLVVNAACHGLGEVRVELLAGDGNPIAGYTMADCVPLERNGTDQEVWWRQGPDVGALIGEPVRLHFSMRSASLYAFEFREDARQPAGPNAARNGEDAL